MFLSIWNYLRGYVTIEISGFSVERFMNLASHKGIYLWDIQKHKSKTQMKVSIVGFKLLKNCAKKTKCKVKIVEKKGWRFFAHKYRKRKVMAAGLFIFFGVLYFLSSFIWIIEINGNERIHSNELMKSLESYNVKIGTWKSNIDTDKVESYLMDHFKDVAWTAVDIKGTKVIVELTETVEKPLIIDRTTPCHLVAEKTGLIMNITTRSGTPKVKPNDVVKKGDILISGEVIVKEDEEGTLKKFVHADADIIAKTRYELTYDQPLYYIERQYTNNVKKQYSIHFLNKQLNLLKSDIPFEHYEKSINKTQLSLTKHFILPVQGITYEYKEFIPVKHKRSLEKAQEIAEETIKKKLLEEIDGKGEIASDEINFYPKKDFLRAKAVFTIIEHIEKPQVINREEITNGTKGKNITDTN